jgi:tRNA pseudouridine38-40 synthase
MRYSLTLAYNGTTYLGSQTQKESANTVLGVVETVLNRLGIESKVVASGRTDKGVHATGQVCHVDAPLFWNNPNKLQQTLNRMLPPSIQAKSIKIVSSDFHARYSAKKRVYRYILKEGESNPFEDSFVTFEKNIDFNALCQKMKLYIGEHDFKYFMKTGSDTKSSVREIYRAFAYKHKDYIVLYFEANGFLRSQIRLMVGALVQLSEKEILEQLNLEKQHKVKPAKSNGLYLAKIKY